MMINDFIFSRKNMYVLCLFYEDNEDLIKGKKI